MPTRGRPAGWQNGADPEDSEIQVADVRNHQQMLLKGWVKKLSPLLFPGADSFSLDFHSIVHRGEETDLENHYQPLRGKAGPTVLTFFAMEQKSRVFCYANANLIRSQEAGEIVRFVDFWRNLTGKNPLPDGNRRIHREAFAFQPA
jgi:hypothetical protein